MNNAFVKLGDRWISINDVVYVDSRNDMFYVVLRGHNSMPLTIKYTEYEGYDPAELMQQWENALRRLQR